MAHVSELETACEAACRAGVLLRSAFGSVHQVQNKGPADLVTEMDRRSEELLREMLLAAFPSYGFHGEESGGRCAPGQPCWIVDPLDGTTNYAHGYPFYSVSVALEHNGNVVVGAVYNPMLDELFAAARGRGAALNGQTIEVSRTGDLGQALVASGFPYSVWHDEADNASQWRSLLKRVISLRSDGSAALDLCHVASGRLDGYWELDLDPWDMAAGVLIVEEAGGTVTHVTGAAFSIYGRGILASNGCLHPAMLDALR